MEKQNQVKRTLEQPASMEAIRAILARNECSKRSALVKAVCRGFGFLESRGGPQIGGCSKALRELERAGHFVLPVPTRPNVTGPKGPRPRVVTRDQPSAWSSLSTSLTFIGMPPFGP